MRSNGFSLIEIVFSLVLVGVAATLIIPFFQSGVTSSGDMVQRAEANANLQQAMERVIARYEELAFLNSYDADGNARTDTGLYVYDPEDCTSTGTRQIRSTYFGPLDYGIYSYGHTEGTCDTDDDQCQCLQQRNSDYVNENDDLTTFRTELANNFSQFDPSNTITATLSANSRLSLLSDPQVTDLTADIDRNQAFILTLRAPDGQSLSYIFVTGGNFPAYLDS